MDIQVEKIELAKLLLSTDNPKIIESIRKIFRKEQPVDFWDELTSSQKEEIEKASMEIDEGKTTDYEKFMSKHR